MDREIFVLYLDHFAHVAEGQFNRLIKDISIDKGGHRCILVDDIASPLMNLYESKRITTWEDMTDPELENRVFRESSNREDIEQEHLDKLQYIPLAILKTQHYFELQGINKQYRNCKVLNKCPQVFKRLYKGRACGRDTVGLYCHRHD